MLGKDAVAEGSRFFSVDGNSLDRNFAISDDTTGQKEVDGKPTGCGQWLLDYAQEEGDVREKEA